MTITCCQEITIPSIQSKETAVRDVCAVQDKLNEKETAFQVKRFFDEQLYDYLANAGLHRADLKSPQLDQSGVSSHGGNSAEEKMMTIFDYQNKVAAVGSAIKNCTQTERHPNREILRLTVIEELTETQQVIRLAMSDRTYSRKKKEALCEFASRVQFWAFKCNTSIPELRRYGDFSGKAV